MREHLVELERLDGLVDEEYHSAGADEAQDERGPDIDVEPVEEQAHELGDNQGNARMEGLLQLGGTGGGEGPD